MQAIYTFVANLLNRLLTVLALIMIFGVILACVGFILATIGIIGALISLATSGSTAAVSAVLGVPVFGNLIIIGLSLVLIGIVIFLVALTLYLLVGLIISQLPRLLPITNLDVLSWLQSILANADEVRCLLAPLLPAGVMLLLTIPVGLFLYLALNRRGLGLENPGAQTLIIAVVVMLCVFGILLALVPIIWCCCCKCRKGGELSKLLDPFFELLGTAAEGAADVVLTGDSAIGGAKTMFSTAGKKLNTISQQMEEFKIEVPTMPGTAKLSEYVKLVPPPPDEIMVLTGGFGETNRIDPPEKLKLET